MKDEMYTYEGFKLISLELNGNTLMGKSELFYDFIEKEDTQKSIYTTVLIGANGTGKSNLFRIIIELFKEISDLNKDKKLSHNVDGRYNLKYSLNGDIYEYSNIPERGKFMDILVSKEGPKPHLKKNGIRIDISKVPFPLAIVANSISLTDKYPFYRKDITNKGEKENSFPCYKYLGVRNVAQNASTRAYVRKTVEFIVQEFQSQAFRKGLVRALNFLGLEEAIEIFYYTANTSTFFNGNLSFEVLTNYFYDIKNKYPSSEANPPFKLNHFLKIQGDQKLLVEICNFCNRLNKENRLIKSENRYKFSRKIIYNLFDKNSFEQLNHDFSMIEQLRQLGMISVPEISLMREGGYTLQESSSGEYHFFSSMVGLMATVKMNSLVFIDEPEISLHPNWQMKYLSFIRELFADPNYATSHIFIATHSHFLISDLKGESAKILGLKRVGSKIEIVDLPHNVNTFGRSAEQILLEIFKVPTTRNYYVAEKLGEILDLISKPVVERNDSLIRLNVRNLTEYNLDKLSVEDPLYDVISKLIKRYGTN